MNLRKILASNLWFLIGAILFLLSGVRYLLLGDIVGGIIYFVASLLFLLGYIGQVKFNKPKKK